MHALIKRFDAPDETRTFEKGKFDVIKIGHLTIGRAKALMNDGRELNLTPGDFFSIGPGHDSWVVGDEPYVSLHFMGADSYAK